MNKTELSIIEVHTALLQKLMKSVQIVPFLSQWTPNSSGHDGRKDPNDKIAAISPSRNSLFWSENNHY